MVAQAMAGPSGAACGCSNTSGGFKSVRSWQPQCACNCTVSLCHRALGCMATAPWITSRGYCAQTPFFLCDSGNATPLLSGCTVHAQGLKSSGGRFIWGWFCSGTQAIASCTSVWGCCGRYLLMIWLDRKTGPEVKQGLCHNRQTRCLLQQAQQVLLRGVGLSQHCSGGLL